MTLKGSEYVESIRMSPSNDNVTDMILSNVRIVKGPEFDIVEATRLFKLQAFEPAESLRDDAEAECPLEE